MSRSLAVVLYGQHIGEVTQTDHGAHSFAYTEQHLRAGSPTPLSLSMPLAPATYTTRRIDPWMLGLLPDHEDVRERWARQLGVRSAANPFALLSEMGMDCAGAAQFVAGDVDEALRQPPDLTPVSDADIGTRLDALRSDPTSWRVSGERWSLAGAQAKFTLTRNQAGDWFEASGSAPSTHIIKPGISHYRDHALNEHVCLSTARLLGLSAVQTEFRDFAGRDALVVTRYDRRRVRGQDSVRRVHQEDLCQALSVYPRHKYESSGGPSAAQVAALLRAASGENDVVAFVTAVIFNYLIGAPDAHAKNYAILLAGADVRLAPMYDVASGFPYVPERPDHELDRAAMAIGGHRVFGSVEARHWDRFAQSCGIEPELVRELVSAMCRDLPGALDEAFHPFVGRHGDLRERLLLAVGQHTERTLAALTTAPPGTWRAPAHAGTPARYRPR